MPRVDITLNGRIYSVGCEEGQEARLRQLAGYFDGHLRSVVSRAPAAGESQLLVLGALMVADQLFDLKAEYDALTRAQSTAPAAGISAEEEAVVMAAVDHLARRIEDIAARLEDA